MALNPATKQQRNTANFQPSSWSYDFMESIANQNNIQMHVEEEYVKKTEVEIRRMLDINEGDLGLLELVDDVDRLGLGYKFEESINKALERLQSSQIIDNINDLHACALYFRLLRQHGHHISTGNKKDIFERFKNSDNRFMESLCMDMSRGVLSLYEASYLAFDGENILEEAREFSIFHLKNILIDDDVDKKFGERVRHALELPSHHRMPRLEARWNIEMYDHNKNVTKQMLHKLAILDFNMVQYLHQLELQEVTRWWRRVGIAKELSFARDRVMENFFWSVGMVYEPEFSKCRVELAKVGTLITILDDIYDVFGTPQELDQLTQVVEKWDMNCVNDDHHHLPDYMKMFFLALNNTINDLAYQTLKKQDQLIIYQGWADLCKSFLQEAKWSYNKHIPKLGEYLENAWISSSGVVALIHVYFFMTQTIDHESQKGFIHCHGLLRFPSMIFRLANDLCSSEKDVERGEANAVPCYMHETGSSHEVARAYIKELIDHNWKMMNKEIYDNSIFHKYYINTCCNLARIATCQYQYGVDAHTSPNGASRNRVNSVIIDPIQLETPF